jgi:L-histidine Nalpha-methyltransferase
MKVNQVGNESSDNHRFRWINFNPIAASLDDGGDVIQGLNQSQKTLPCRYLYDDSPEERLRQRGSELFEQITDLPEYYPTRTEQAILEKHALEIAELTGACELI